MSLETKVRTQNLWFVAPSLPPPPPPRSYENCHKCTDMTITMSKWKYLLWCLFRSAKLLSSSILTTINKSAVDVEVSTACTADINPALGCRVVVASSPSARILWARHHFHTFGTRLPWRMAHKQAMKTHHLTLQQHILFYVKLDRKSLYLWNSDRPLPGGEMKQWPLAWCWNRWPEWKIRSAGSFLKREEYKLMPQKFSCSLKWL